MSKVIVGLSGGVDSAVAALLLKKEGYDVTGVTLRTWEAEDGTESRCCEIDDARSTAMKIGIPYYALNCKEDFRRFVTEPFTESYIKGETPNPCIGCNRHVKWDRMMYYAKVMKADYIATGHYARKVQLPNGRYTVKSGTDTKKDQTYMLYKLTQDQLMATLLPLSGMTKEEVRNIASKAGLTIAGKPDSQEICFVPDGDYAGYIEKNAGGNIPGEGDFVDEAGNVLGRHKGIIRYTVGQRKGLGIAFGRPMFVKRIDAAKNEVILGEEGSLYTKEIICRDTNFLSIPGLAPGESVKGNTRIRYHHPGCDGVITGMEGGRVKIVFDEPVKAATPGQSAVFYDREGCVIGGGVIC